MPTLMPRFVRDGNSYIIIFLLYYLTIYGHKNSTQQIKHLTAYVKGGLQGFPPSFLIYFILNYKISRLLDGIFSLRASLTG